MCRIGLGFEQALQYIWSFHVARLGARLVVLALFMRFAVYAVQAFYEFRTFNYLILLVGEVITMSLVVLARDTKKVKLTLVALLAAVAGSFYYLFFSFNLGAGHCFNGGFRGYSGFWSHLSDLCQTMSRAELWIDSC